MQPEAFSLFAEASGFDVLALRREYRCSYTSATLRLAEVMREQPLMAVLYERQGAQGEGRPLPGPRGPQYIRLFRNPATASRPALRLWPRPRRAWGTRRRGRRPR